MNAREQLRGYLGGIERRLRWITLARGLAAVAAVAVLATLLAVVAANRFAFSPASVTAARWFLYLALSAAACFALAWPLARLNLSQAARRAERRAPELEQRLLTLAERDRDEQPDPFLELLAAETLEQIQQAGVEPPPVRRPLAGLLAAAGLAAAILTWLVRSGPGFLGYGAALLWAGPQPTAPAPYYAIVVQPGNATVRRHADQLITARLVGFEAPEVRLLARYEGTAQWEEAVMRPQSGGPGFELLLAGIPQNLTYYVTAGRLRSPTYAIRVADLPQVRRIRVTYRYPSWTGLAPASEDPGGDLRAVEGTEAEILVETDRPLEDGALELGDGRRVALQGAGNQRSARLRIESDGRYHIAMRDKDGWVRLSEDYLILAEKDAPPEVRIRRPGRDARVSPIEEVTIEAEAAAPFGVKELTLTYSVNGGPERKVTLADRAGEKRVEGSTTLYLEDFRLAPGDVVSFYASARSARQSAQSDIYFLEAEPFEREYSQSQQAASGEGQGGEQDDRRISERQKEIIAATWNQIRARSQDAETARFLSGVQARLRDQAQSLARRMGSRELSATNQEFQTFSREMAQAAEAMSAAAEKLQGARWQEALRPEQAALQHLLRAEATFRQIQVAFGSRGGRGGNGGRGGAGRDLESLFELELDTEKNQYETAQSAGAGSPEQREFQEALRKLEELARRQQELLARQGPRQSFEQRWQQEMLRREALELQRQMESLARQGAAGQGTAGQSAAAAREGRSGERERLRAMGRGGMDPRVREALERLAQAARDMTRAETRQQAAEQLRQARDLLSGLERRQADERVSELARRSERLAQQQREFAERLRRLFGNPETRGTREDAQRLAEEKQGMLAELERLQRDLEQISRDLASSQRAAASRLREALGDLQRQELATRMRYNAELIRRGWGQVAILREAPVTAGLEQLREQLRQAQAALDRADPSAESLPQALAALRRARERLAGDSRRGEPGTRSDSRAGQAGRQESGAAAARVGPESGLAGARTGAGRRAPGSYAAMNFGDWQPPEPTGAHPQDPAAIARAYEDALRDLARLRGVLGKAPEELRELEELLRDYGRYDPRRAPGNPALLERMRVQFLADLDRLELQWRRKLGEAGGEQAQGITAESAPTGYQEAVAEYFRRLSRAK